MQRDVQTWLSSLPLADEEEASGIPLEGWLLSRSSTEVLVLAGDLGLEFADADVVRVVRLDAGDPPGDLAVRVAVVVRRGAPLLGVWPRGLWEHRLPRGRAPFALSTRPEVIRSGPMPGFRALERQYLDALAPSATHTQWS